MDFKPISVYKKKCHIYTSLPETVRHKKIMLSCAVISIMNQLQIFKELSLLIHISFSVGVV